MDLLRHSRTNTVKRIAKELGFDYCGISKAEFLEKEARDLESWLKKGYQGDMAYMESSFDMRTDPRLLVPGAKSVVSLLMNYYPQQIQTDKSDFKLSKYAYGRDYHKVIKKQLKHFIRSLKSEIGEVDGRIFVDLAPVMDKAWAQRSGLGWIGKHSNLINKEQGSFFFIAELILDIELEVNGPIEDYCGSCTKCIDACPTDALVEPYKIDGSKCISYLTIELKDKIPEEFKGKMEGWVFGCDICQDVCPWNRFKKPHQNPDLKANPRLLEMSNTDWEEMTEEIFNEVFVGSPIKRTQYHGLKRNIGFTKI